MTFPYFNENQRTSRTTPCIVVRQERINNMKIKLFHYRRWQKPLEDFEKEVDDFMATVEVVDVKYSSSSFGDSSSMDIIDGVLVVYK